MGDEGEREFVSRRLAALAFTNDWPSDGAAVVDFGGTLIGERGRGILAAFESCHDAMLALTSAGETVAMSAGLAFGEVAFDQGEVFGEAVVEAARLAAVCPLGAVYATDMVCEHLSDLPSDNLGPIELKGIGTVGHHRFDLGEVTGVLNNCSRIDRRDVAMLSCDIVGSTDLLETLGTDVAISVQRAFDQALKLACSGGEILDQHGDGVVVRFPSATQAIRAAIELQRAAEDHSLRAGNAAFTLRSGVAAGPDPEADARALEGRARPGEVMISETAQALAFDLAEEIVDGALRPKVVEAAAFPNQLAINDDLPLVGRAASLSALAECWDDVLASKPGVTFLTGEAGIGKTRLVSAFARARHVDGALVLFGSSDMELTVPYRPFAEALSTAVEPESAVRDRLRPLFPERSIDAPIDDSDVAGPDRTQLFESVSATLAALSQTRPLLLILDDLHWSSSETALLLRHLVHHPPVGRVMILGTFRDGEVDRGHPLFDVVNDQEVIGRATRLPLQHLAVDDVAELVAAHFGTEVGDGELRLADRIHLESSGLPFFTGEVLRHLADVARQSGSAVSVAATETLSLPASVIDAVHQRLGRLDDATCRTLEVAATSGLVFDVDVVASTLGTSIADVVDQLEAAQRLALVRESGRAGQFQFDHALVRSALLTGLSATRVAMIHQQIAEALEHQPGDQNDALAHHWRQANGPVARQRAVHHLIVSAERDASSLAWEAAKSRYEDALDLAGDDGVIDQATVVAMHLARARAMRASGDPDYLVAMRETGRLARTAGLADVIAQVAINSTKPGTWFANANESDQHLIGLCEDALAAPELDPVLRCRVLATLATNLAFDADRSGRRAMVDEALELARTINDPDLVASALIAEHLAFWDPSTLDRRVEIIAELDRLARRRDNADHLFLAGFFRASMLLECGQISDARRALEGLDEHIARTRNFWFRFLVNRMETALAVVTCNPDAKALVDKLFEESFETQADAAGTWGAQLGGLAIQVGTFGSMVDQLAAASERSRGQGVWSCGLAIARLDQGDHEGARATLGLVENVPLDFMWLVSQQMIAEAAYRLDDRELCSATLERLRPFAGRVGVIASGTLVFSLVSISIGEAAMGAGDLDLAQSSLRSAIEQADRLEFPFCQVRSRRRLLESMTPQQREGDEWSTELASALELADAHQFPSELAALDGLADR